jgi:CHAD domain-containing protein
MAKPREITGLDCSRRSLAWVPKVLLTRFDEMAGFRHAALGFAQIKGVHDMRVAARRVRSALRDLGPFLQKDPLKDIKQELRSISDALGAVRDRDVTILALKTLSDEADSGPVKTGIDTFAGENVQKRNIARIDLTAIITADHIDGLRKKLKASLKEATIDAEPLSFNAAAGRMVAANLDDLLALAPRLYKPFKRNGLHKLRIAAKRLRYSLELAALCYGAEAKKLAKEISRLQDHLGELHDCDIWIEDLGARLAGVPDENELEAAAWMLPAFVRKQNKEYLTALELWKAWQKNNFVERVKKVVSFA